MSVEATALLSRLSRLDSCAVSDALDALGLPGAVTGLAPVWQGARLVGRAVTVGLAPGEPPPDSEKVHLGARAVVRATEGDVIVIDNGGRTEMGGWGGLLSLAAAQQGAAGVVLDGACRDIDEARELAFPVFARAGVCRTARGRVHEVSTGSPVEVGGAVVHDGDYVIADGSGVVVIPAGRADEVLDRAESIAERERGMASRLRSGESPRTVLGVEYESMLSAESEL